MDKKNLLLPISIIIGCAILSFTLYGTQLTKKQESVFNKKNKCIDICNDILKNENNVFSKNIKYHYNKKLDSCFYEGGTDDVSKVIWKRVLNCQTNETVLLIRSIPGNIHTEDCSSCASSLADYNEKRKVFMEN